MDNPAEKKKEVKEDIYTMFKRLGILDSIKSQVRAGIHERLTKFTSGQQDKPKHSIYNIYIYI